MSEERLIRRIRDLFNVYSRFRESWDQLWKEFREVCSRFGLDPEQAMEYSLWLEEKNGGLYIRLRLPEKTLSRYVRKDNRELARKLLDLRNELKERYKTAKFIENSIRDLDKEIKSLIEFIKDELG